MLRRACTEITAHEAVLGHRLLLTVNVSGRELGEPGYPERFTAVLAETGRSPARTGYSSLARLDTLPADYLKLDHTFTASLATSNRRARLMSSIVAMNEALGMELIAEGVEDVDQATTLRRLGVGLAQGYRYARPGPLAEVLPGLVTAS